MIKYFLNLGNKAIQKYTTKKQELPLTNNDIIEEVDVIDNENDNEDDNASTHIIDMEQQEDIGHDEEELRKRN